MQLDSILLEFSSRLSGWNEPYDDFGFMRIKLHNAERTGNIAVPSKFLPFCGISSSDSALIAFRPIFVLEQSIISGLFDLETDYHSGT